MAKLIHPELSYQVRGVLFDVYNKLGPLLKESYYRDAIGIGLQQRGLACVLEKGFEVFYQEERVGLYYVDVLGRRRKNLVRTQGCSADCRFTQGSNHLVSESHRCGPGDSRQLRRGFAGGSPPAEFFTRPADAGICLEATAL